MKRLYFIAEDLVTGAQQFADTKKTAKESAKLRSMQTGHVVAVIAVDRGDNDKWHPQGAYYGRSWREGEYHYPGSRRG